MKQTISFDEQAPEFDARAGLAQTNSRVIAAAIVDFAQLGERDRLLEIGAGTGEIGAHLIDQHIEYLALDNSRAMLDVFAQRVAPKHQGRLIEGDANARWPVDDGTLRVTFSSRVAHLLEPEWLWSESQRCAGPRGCWLIVGRRVREHSSVRARMRRQMLELLANAGVEHRSSGGPARMLDAMEKKGGSERRRVEVVRWPVVHRPIDAIDAWRSKSGMAGVELDEALKTRVLDRLTSWASAYYGDLGAEHASEEHYELSGLLVPGR